MHLLFCFVSLFKFFFIRQLTSATAIAILFIIILFISLNKIINLTTTTERKKDIYDKNPNYPIWMIHSFVMMHANKFKYFDDCKRNGMEWNIKCANKWLHKYKESSTKLNANCYKMIIMDNQYIWKANKKCEWSNGARRGRNKVWQHLWQKYEIQILNTFINVLDRWAKCWLLLNRSEEKIADKLSTTINTQMLLNY